MKESARENFFFFVEIYCCILCKVLCRNMAEWFCKNNWVGVTFCVSAGLWLVKVTPLWWVDEFLLMWGWAGTTGCLNLTLGQQTVNWPRGKKWVALYWWKNQSVSWFMKPILSRQSSPVLLQCIQVLSVIITHPTHKCGVGFVWNAHKCRMCNWRIY